MNLYEIETKFYTHFSTNCGARVPDVYLADYDPASGDELIVRGYGTCKANRTNGWLRGGAS